MIFKKTSPQGHGSVYECGGYKITQCDTPKGWHIEVSGKYKGFQQTLGLAKKSCANGDFSTGNTDVKSSDLFRRA